MMRTTVSLLVSLLFLSSLLLGASSTSTPSTPKYDFIVVGAGAAGSIVAARLASETSKSVLLLEGGALGSGQRDIGGTAFAAVAFKHDSTGKLVPDVSYTIYDVPPIFNLITTASDVYNNTWPITPVGPFFAQAKVIGGNMAINGMGWLCPQNKEFDAWGIPGFNGTEMRAYLMKVENATETGYGTGNARGVNGKINIKYGSFTPNEQLLFRNACIASGYPDAGDINKITTTPGVYHTQSNVKHGVRQSTSITYLASILDSCGDRLTFIPSATVTRVVFSPTTSSSSLPTATGVEYVDAKGVLHKANANLEVILASGDLQTAKILLNSGIGPLRTLNAFGKPVIRQQENIGQKIRNQQRVTMIFNSSSIPPPTFFALPSAANEYARNGTGLLDITSTYSLYLTAVDPADTITSLGVVAGTNVSPYSQLLGATPGLNINSYANGTLNLTSSDPLAPTLFTANVLQLADDQTRLAKALLETRRVMSHWPGTPLMEITPGTAVVTNLTTAIAWVKANVGTTCHYYGSAPMGTVPSSATDPRMRVNGVKKLRIVGPAVVPGQVRLGMQCLAVLLGEKGTDLIKQDNGL